MTMTPQNPQNHEQIRHRLFAHADGELPEAERGAIQAHLEGCPDCRSALRRWETLTEAFFRVPAPPSSGAFVRRVMARIDAERRERLAGWAPWEGAWRWLVPALGAGIAALVLVVTMPWRESPVSTETLLLASSARNGAFDAMMQQEPNAEEMLGLVLEQPREQSKEQQ
jgi:anti-sigma factor RsiW